MIFWICGILAVIIWLVSNYLDWGITTDVIFITPIIFFLGLIIATVICLIPWGETTVNEIEIVEIHALTDNIEYEGVVSGSVFLVRGKVNETLKYRYMYYENGKGYGFDEVNANNSYLNYIEDENTIPYLEIRKYKYANPTLNFFIPCSADYDYIFWLPSTAEVIDEYTIDFN